MVTMRTTFASVLLTLLVAASASAATTPLDWPGCCEPTASVRIHPGDSLSWNGASMHPLASTSDRWPTTTSAHTEEFTDAGRYGWYCTQHGDHDGITATGMGGNVVVSDNALPTASFTASATQIDPGGQVAFDASASADPDPGQTISYAWDLDGDGADDPGQTGPTAQATYPVQHTVKVRLTVTDTNAEPGVGPESVITIKTIQV